MLVTTRLLVAINLHSKEKYYGSQWLPANVWLPTLFETFFLCVQQNKEIDTGLEQNEGE